MTSNRAARDVALDTLMLPFQDGSVTWPADPPGVLFLRARAGASLPRDAAHWSCEQSFRPWADGLLQAGLALVPMVASGAFARVLLLPQRQRQESRALLARASRLLAPDGMLVVAQHNDEGARSLQDDMHGLFGTVNALSKNHCRAVWASAGTVDAALADAWLADDSPRPMGADGLLRRPGVFAWDRLDVGSALLIDALPTDLSGHVADLGAGVGALSVELLHRCPGIRALDLFEAEGRALDLARANIEALSPDIPVDYHWRDVAAGIQGRFDAIVMNPPFHTGRAADPGLGQAFIAAAASSLVSGGRLLLVANRHLPYEATLGAAFTHVHRLREADGFKVVEARRSAR